MALILARYADRPRTYLGDVDSRGFYEVFEGLGHGLSSAPCQSAKGRTSSCAQYWRIRHGFSPPFKTKKPLAGAGKWPLVDTVKWLISDFGAVGLLYQTVIGKRVIPVVGH